ncbi:hypothetical protein L7F22_020091 [Adiantum nelumboides]|nr:hypothetical protein [Adiantum nelumboides]
MAFSFSLPELQAELRALGHDGLPDHVILSFLSHLKLPLPSPSALSRCSSTSLDSSGYDSEASFCSTHSLSCGYGSPNTCTGDVAAHSFVELVAQQPLNRTSCQEEAPSITKNGRHASNLSRSAPLLNAENHKPDLGTDAIGAHNSTPGQELGRQLSPDKIIEHYWISVGQEHMRAMHSKTTKETQLKNPPALKVQATTSASGVVEGKIGYRSLIEKVEQCEEELQRLTLRLQAQQCKKPWFLEIARKPRIYQRDKYDAGASHNPSLEQLCTHTKERPNRSELSVMDVSSTHTCTENVIKGLSFAFSQEVPSQNVTVAKDGSEQLPYKGTDEAHPLVTQQEGSEQLLVKGIDDAQSLELQQEGYEQLLDKRIDEARTLETQPTGSLSVVKHNELEEPIHHQNQKDSLACGLRFDQGNEPDPSVCSKSSSASYQHSSLQKCKNCGRKMHFLLLTKQEERERECRVSITSSQLCTAPGPIRSYNSRTSNQFGQFGMKEC